MITDDQLYNLALFLGISAMILIVVYHFLEVNSENTTTAAQASAPAQAGGKAAR